MFRALHNRVIIKPFYQQYQGKVILPKYCPEFKLYYGYVYGEVVAIGDEYPYKELKAGDKILWRRHEGKKFVYDNQVYFNLQEKWVQAIINIDGIVPIGNRLIVKLIPQYNNKLIYIPKTVEPTQAYWKVIHSGISTRIKKDDTIILPKYLYEDNITITGERILIIEEKEVMMKMRSLNL